MLRPTPMPTGDSHPARVSLRDVARAVGVSHVTISLALRGDSRISEARRAEIKIAAEKIGYRPDPMLSSLAAYRQAKQNVTIRATIAWINQWPDPKALRRWHEFNSYWKGALLAAEQLGYRLEEFVVGRDLPPERLQKILQARGVRGILIPPHTHGLALPGFDWSDFSLVRFGISVRHPRVHVVTSDQLNCATMAFERIHERGYRRIGFVSSRNFDRNTGGNFRAGYLSAQDAFVAPRQHLAPFFLEEDSTPADAKALRAWLKKAKPDAVITTHAGLHGLLTKIGVRVPDDLPAAAISVLDGDFDAGVDQNSGEVGRVALRTLAGLIHQNERGIPQFCRRILVEGRWIDGSSLPNRAPTPSAL
jgi:LacI family transcriptional regulator